MVSFEIKLRVALSYYDNMPTNNSMDGHYYMGYINNI